MKSPASKAATKRTNCSSILTTQTLLDFDLEESSSDSDFRIEDHDDDSDDYSVTSGKDNNDGNDDSDDGDEDDSSNDSEDSSEIKDLKSEQLSTSQLLDIVNNKHEPGPSNATNSNISAAVLKLPTIPICCACLGERSDDTNEIVECDGCGVTVHEGCYGVSDSVSVSSTTSSCTTEPWFCEACRAGCMDPICELCPNKGGIFKETDVGRWVRYTYFQFSFNN